MTATPSRTAYVTASAIAAFYLADHRPVDNFAENEVLTQAPTWALGLYAQGRAVYASRMDIRQITPDYAVSPQIEPEDLPALKEAGFATVICNRPDVENPVELQAEVLKVATEAAGLRFVELPVVHSELTMETVQAQADAIAESDGPVFAYCASGTRSSIVWALSQAGKMPTQEIIVAAANAGYDLSHLAPQLEALANR